jgi:O-succinylbenzoic acid--CoA ligase
VTAAVLPLLLPERPVAELGWAGVPAGVAAWVAWLDQRAVPTAPLALLPAPTPTTAGLLLAAVLRGVPLFLLPRQGAALPLLWAEAVAAEPGLELWVDGAVPAELPARALPPPPPISSLRAAAASTWSVAVATGGSSGGPRWVRHGRAGLLAAAAAQAADLAWEAQHTWGCPLGPETIGAVLAVLRAAHAGGRLRLGGWDPALWATADWQGASLAPVMARQLLETGVAGAGRRVLLGGADASQALLAALRQADWRPTLGYGMTETAAFIARDGRLLPDWQARSDDHGRLWLRGPWLAQGYGAPAAPATAALAAADGWWATGDAGAVVDGALHIAGRWDDVIVTGARKVAPTVLEALLERHPAVRAAAVCGLPDERWGQVVGAVLEGVEPADWTAWLLTHCAAHERPRRWRFVAALPRSHAGKIIRQHLPALLADPTCSGAPSPSGAIQLETPPCP